MVVYGDHKSFEKAHGALVTTKTIWKYAIEPSDNFRVDLPAGAEFLSVQSQFETPQMWWLVDPTAPKAARRFAVHGTGHTIRGVKTYLGTFQMNEGTLVFHLFEVV